MPAHRRVLTQHCIHDRAAGKRHPHTSMRTNTQALRRPSGYAVRAVACSPGHLIHRKVLTGQRWRTDLLRGSTPHWTYLSEGRTRPLTSEGRGSLAFEEAFGPSRWVFLLSSVLTRQRSTIQSSNSDISLSEQKTREFYILLGHILFTESGSGGHSPRQLEKHDIWRSLHKMCNEFWCTAPNNTVNERKPINHESPKVLVKWNSLKVICLCWTSHYANLEKVLLVIWKRIP